MALLPFVAASAAVNKNNKTEEKERKKQNGEEQKKSIVEFVHHFGLQQESQMAFPISTSLLLPLPFPILPLLLLYSSTPPHLPPPPQICLAGFSSLLISVSRCTSTCRHAGG